MISRDVSECTAAQVCYAKVRVLVGETWNPEAWGRVSGWIPADRDSVPPHGPERLVEGAHISPVRASPPSVLKEAAEAPLARGNRNPTHVLAQLPE